MALREKKKHAAKRNRKWSLCHYWQYKIKLMRLMGKSLDEIFQDSRALLIRLGLKKRNQEIFILRQIQVLKFTCLLFASGSLCPLIAWNSLHTELTSQHFKANPSLRCFLEETWDANGALIDIGERKNASALSLRNFLMFYVQKDTSEIVQAIKDSRTQHSCDNLLLDAISIGEESPLRMLST